MSIRLSGGFNTNTVQILPQGIDILVVGGGGGSGGGGSTNGRAYGGAGPGGVILLQNQIISQGTTVTVTVGAGGAINSVGSDSVFGTFTAYGGGSRYSVGASWGTIGAYTAGNYDGSSGTAGQNFGGGGSAISFPGGGAGGASTRGGSTVFGRRGGCGGKGRMAFGQFYSGGGGGGGSGAGTPANSPGGLGFHGSGSGGGLYICKYSPTAGQANTGGAAGGPSGGDCGNASAAANSGGSGIVIISYPTSLRALTSIGGGLTYTLSTSNSRYYYRFTGGTGSITF
jgi:hypothetical protein